MNVELSLFFFFAFVLVISAFRVITARNPVHAVLFLVMAFFSTSCIWMTLGAEFLAISLVLVYVGAVMVLFLFVVMMFDLSIDRMREGFWKHFPLGATVATIIAVQLWLVLSHGHWQTVVPAKMAPGVSNTEALGLLTFTQYVYPLEIAGTLLLVAMVSAISLTLRDRKDAKSQVPSEQIRVKAADRIRMVSLAADVSAKQDVRTSVTAK